MLNATATVGDVERTLDEFRRYVADDLRSRVWLTEPYRVRDPGKHWPKPYEEVWRDAADGGINPGTGVYLLFDDADRLLYIGTAVSIGARLGSYFKFAQDRKGCDVIDERFKGVLASVRIVPLVGDVTFLAPALEVFLISRLTTPFNKHHNRGTWADEEAELQASPSESSSESQDPIRLP